MFWKNQRNCCQQYSYIAQKNRLSLEELGKLSGVSKSMLALIEKETEIPLWGFSGRLPMDLGYLLMN